MPLLLQDVSFTLPFPDKELALLFTAHSNPVTRSIHSNAINFILRDLERVNGLQSVQVVQAEYSI